MAIYAYVYNYNTGTKDSDHDGSSYPNDIVKNNVGLKYASSISELISSPTSITLSTWDDYRDVWWKNETVSLTNYYGVKKSFTGTVNGSTAYFLLVAVTRDYPSSMDDAINNTLYMTDYTYSGDTYVRVSGPSTNRLCFVYAYSSSPVPTYTCYLRYNGNGGEDVPEDQSWTSPSTADHTFTISYSDPSRTGYIFLGWDTSSSATTVVYTAGDYIDVPYNGSVTLYAVWEQIFYTGHWTDTSGNTITTLSLEVGESKTVRMIPDTATSSQGNSLSIGSAGGTKASGTLTRYSSTRFDVTFTGVSAGSTTATVTYTASIDGNQYFSNQLAITVTAPLPTYTCYLNFNANGGSGAPSNLSYTGSSTSDHTFIIPLNSPSKSGYAFLGWSTSSSASTPSYVPGGTISVGYNSTTILYAVWSANSYTVTFDAGSGSVSPSSKTVTFGSTYGELPTPTWAGHTFAGWFTEASGGTQVTASTEVTTASNHTLHAHWDLMPCTMYAESGDSTKGLVRITSGSQSSGSYASTATLQVASGSNVTFHASAQSGYMLKYWMSIYPQPRPISSNPEYTLSNVTSDLSLVATFETLRFRLIFDDNGGRDGPGTLEYVDPFIMISHRFEIPSTEPYRPGYDFKGWCVSGTSTPVYRYGTVNDNYTVYVSDPSVTMVAQWEARIMVITLYAGNSYSNVVFPNLNKMKLVNSPVSQTFGSGTVILSNLED